VNQKKPRDIDKMSFDNKFLKNLMLFIAMLMTPQGKRKIQEIIKDKPSVIKNIVQNISIIMNSIDPEEFKEIFEQLNKNPYFKIQIIDGIPKAHSKITNKVSGEYQEYDLEENEIEDPECFWVGNEYHIILDCPDDSLKFNTGINKKDPKDIVLFVKDSDDKIIKKINLPFNISYNEKISQYNNGIYEIIYKEKK
jgi:hypothetical protein